MNRKITPFLTRHQQKEEEEEDENTARPRQHHRRTNQNIYAVRENMKNRFVGDLISSYETTGLALARDCFPSHIFFSLFFVLQLHD